MIFSITKLSLKGLLATLTISDTQHNRIQHNTLH
jgi:hypothetical protein